MAVGVAWPVKERRARRVGLGVCRRALPNRADAEDAFQATFLVLVRRARGLDPSPTVGPWLHKVASQTAQNARRKNSRRLALFAELPEAVPDQRRGLQPADLDAVLLGLPARCRAVLLCHLEGLTHREAAARLGCPEGTVSSLVSRGLAKLRAKFAGRDPAAILTLAVMVVPTATATATVRSAASLRLASLSAAASPAVASLTRGVIRMFWIKKATAVGLAAAVLFAAGIGIGLSARPQALAQETPVKKAGAEPVQPAANPPAVLIDPLAEPEEKVANDEVDPIVYGPVKGNGARDMYTRSSKLEEKVEVEGLALGDGSPDQRVVYDRCMIVVRGVDFKELKASGRPVRVKGTVGRSGGTLVRLRNPEGGYTSTRLPAYYYIEASSLELIDRVTVPRLVAPVAPKAPVGKKDLERLQGVWTITSLEIGGEKLPDETARALSVGVGYTFGPEKVTLVGQVSQKDGQFFIRDGTQVFPYRIDPATKEIDIRTKNKESAKGIYKFDGDDLILCIDFSRAERPATFGTKDKPAYELYRLKKQR